MANPPTQPGWSTARVALLGICGIVVVAMFAAVVRQSWGTNAAGAEVVRLEQEGVSYLHPMTTVLAKLVEAQSAAVRGEPVKAGDLRKALAEVAGEDGEYGGGLRSSQRLVDLTAQVEAALIRNETGRAAYDTYSGLVTLAVDLYRRIGDSSRLVHDPDLDSYYLMDAVIVRLPDAVVLAGRAADLVALAGAAGDLQGEDAVRAAVARFGVSAAAEQVNSGLTKSVDATNRAELGTNIAERLDAFKAAADAFAPPTMLAELAETVDATTLAENARRVSAAASPLAHRLLAELNLLLEERKARLATEWRFTASVSGVAALVGLVMVWLFVARPRGPRPVRPPTRSSPDGPDAGSAAADRPGGASGGPEELVHVGRAVRPATWGNPHAG